jgi:hypothetical protein
VKKRGEKRWAGREDGEGREVRRWLARSPGEGEGKKEKGRET